MLFKQTEERKRLSLTGEEEEKKYPASLRLPPTHPLTPYSHTVETIWHLEKGATERRKKWEGKVQKFMRHQSLLLPIAANLKPSWLSLDPVDYV